MRAMEKENMKLRDVGRKERNEEIRVSLLRLLLVNIYRVFKELVSYVRKRDPRVAAQRKVLEQKRLEQQQKTEEQRKAQIRQRLA